MSYFMINHEKASSLAKKYGTPLYVYDEVKLVERIKEYKNNFKSNKFDTKVIYASKAFSCVYLYKLLQKHGFGIDVVSLGEMITAIKAKVEPSDIYFHGNNKSNKEILIGLNYGEITFVVDNYGELQAIDEISKKINKKCKILLRMNVNVEADTHKYDVTAHLDSKFGMLSDSEEFELCKKLLNQNTHLRFDGYHCHIGSQLFTLDTHYRAIDKMLDLINEPVILNIGGGFGANYTKEDKALTAKEVSQSLINYVEEQLIKRDKKIKSLMIEPGRSIVADSGYTLYTIGNQKITPNKHYYFVDGGMSDNIRPALYQAKYECDLVDRMDEEKTVKATIAGKCCESGDILIEECMLPPYKRNDILIVYSTGAYGYSMASNYNKLEIPGVVFVDEFSSKEVIKKQEIASMIEREIDL
ncbi:MAG: diaminopimelate decarboxylase [Erysipelotrichaceae bacterium]|nr:diaminopimelate decarboxylase [Erysipelotrichaceae bacterium]